MNLLLQFAVASVIGAIAGLALTWLIWRAVGAAVDWFVYTFGNERAVKEFERRRHSGSVRGPQRGRR